MGVLFLKFLNFGINHELAIRSLLVVFVILLMITFCRVKIRERRKFSYNCIFIHFFFLQLLDESLCALFLLWYNIKNRGAILRAEVIPLPVPRRRVVRREKHR